MFGKLPLFRALIPERRCWLLVADIGENFGEFDDNLLLTDSIGARFVSADTALGNDGTEFYFNAGEAF